MAKKAVTARVIGGSPISLADSTSPLSGGEKGASSRGKSITLSCNGMLCAAGGLYSQVLTVYSAPGAGGPWASIERDVVSTSISSVITSFPSSVTSSTSALLLERADVTGV